MTTREKILKMALGLFNKNRTSAVSTNHIAEVQAFVRTICIITSETRRRSFVSCSSACMQLQTTSSNYPKAPSLLSKTYNRSLRQITKSSGISVLCIENLPRSWRTILNFAESSWRFASAASRVFINCLESLLWEASYKNRLTRNRSITSPNSVG